MDDVRDVFVERWKPCPRCGETPDRESPSASVSVELERCCWDVFSEDYDAENNEHNITEAELRADGNDEEGDCSMLCGMKFYCPVCGWSHETTSRDTPYPDYEPDVCPRCDGIAREDIYYCDECEYLAFRNPEDKGSV